MKFDAVIVGARCAGAATALLLARGGARVLVVDRAVEGSDTTSTHALMRGAVLQLHRWGVLPAIVDAGTPAVRSTTFSYRDQDITVAIEPKFDVNALYAPRRTLLDRILVKAAVESGADVRYGVRVDDLTRSRDGRVTGIAALSNGIRQRVEADLVIGADGLYSTVAQAVGADDVVAGHHSTASLYSYWEDLAVDGYYWRFVNGVSLGAIPTNHGATGLFVSVPSDRFRAEVHENDSTTLYRRLIREASPEFDARLASARQVEGVRGFGGHRGFIKRAAGPGWALVGDAAYFKDPLTAHGITDALRDAELLARAISLGTAEALVDFERTRLDLSRRMLEISDEVASFAWTDSDVQSLHRALSAEMSREVRTLAALDPLPPHQVPTALSALP
jgi:2-polyprenyl-6-methoxyphenol hydroxylase-like FAD-dependent oxidoreductase